MLLLRFGAASSAGASASRSSTTSLSAFSSFVAGSAAGPHRRRARGRRQAAAPASRLLRARCAPRPALDASPRAASSAPRLSARRRTGGARAPDRRNRSSTSSRTCRAPASRLARDALGEQDALDDVQPREGPRLEVGREVLAEQPVVEEGLVHLVRQVRPDDLGEERAGPSRTGRSAARGRRASSRARASPRASAPASAGGTRTPPGRRCRSGSRRAGRPRASES